MTSMRHEFDLTADMTPDEARRYAEGCAMERDLRSINAIDRVLTTARPRPVRSSGRIRRALWIAAAFTVGVGLGAYAVHANPIARLQADLALIEARK